MTVVWRFVRFASISKRAKHNKLWNMGTAFEQHRIKTDRDVVSVESLKMFHNKTEIFAPNCHHKCNVGSSLHTWKKAIVKLVCWNEITIPNGGNEGLRDRDIWFLGLRDEVKQDLTKIYLTRICFLFTDFTKWLGRRNYGGCGWVSKLLTIDGLQWKSSYFRHQ